MQIPVSGWHTVGLTIECEENLWDAPINKIRLFLRPTSPGSGGGGVRGEEMDGQVRFVL